MSEEEVTMERIFDICSALEDIGEKGLATKLFKKRIENELEIVETDEWEEHTICDSFPIADKRQLVYCCPETKMCIFRNSVLKKIGVSLSDYTKLKNACAINLFSE